jgi:hypothetical protein
VPPVISAINVAVTPTTAVVSWRTDVIATSRVDYGLTSAYGASVSDTNPVTSHQLSLVGLACNTTYHYQISSTASPSGAVGVSPNATFTTAACVNTQPPVISNVQVAPTQETATVTWNTDLASSSTVNYGPTTAYGSTVDGPGSVTSHTVQLTGLTCASTYYFTVSSATPQSTPSTSPRTTFSTTACPPPDTTPVPPGGIVSGASATKPAVRGPAQRYP